MLRKYQDVSRLASVGFGALLLAIVMSFFATPSTYSINTWLIMGVMGLFTAPFGRVLSIVATRYITAPDVSITLMLEKILAFFWAFIFFSEIPPVESIVGGSLILIAIFLYTIYGIKDEQ